MGMTHRRSDSTVLLAQRLKASGPESLTATGIAPPHLAPRHSKTQWTYRGDQVGVLASIHDGKQTHGIMYFAPFKANGTLGPVRTLSPPAQLRTDLEPCSEEARRKTTRVVHRIARSQSVTVNLPGRAQPIALESHYGVFYGDATPCLAAWTARAPSRRNPFRAQIDARGRGWLFRTHAGGIAFRPMTCHPRSGSLSR